MCFHLSQMSDYDCLKIALQTKLSTDSQPFKPNFKKKYAFRTIYEWPFKPNFKKPFAFGTFYE